jgi:predicted component of type VI protein secretion system
VTDETAIYLRVRGETIRIDGRSAVVGRSRTCDVQIDEQGVSRRHCEVLLREDGASVRDLDSAHGTWVAGERAEGEARLGAGVLVTLGERGPHFELVNAIVHGRPVLGGPPAARAHTVTATHANAGRAVAARPDAVATVPIAAAAKAPTAAATGGTRFWAGLAWGTFAGLVLGAAAASFVDLPF